MEEQNHGYFEEALSNFTKDFAYGGAIRHLVDHGYTVDRIIKEFHYPISREAIEKIVNQYLDGKKMNQQYFVLEQLFQKTQVERTLECTDLFGNIIRCTFEWKPPVCKETLKILKNEFNLNLPEDYEKFLFMSNGAILYNDDEDSGYRLLSLEEAIQYTEKKKKGGYDGIKDDWLIFMSNLFDSDFLLFDMSRMNRNQYILDGIADEREEEWRYLKWDFRTLMNLLFRVNGDNFWRY